MRPRPAFEVPEDTGRLGFREPHEPPDGRPPIARSPFWKDDQEQATWEHATEANPHRPDETDRQYMTRIIALVEGRYAQAAQNMPRGRLNKHAHEKRWLRIQEQRAEILKGDK